MKKKKSHVRTNREHAGINGLVSLNYWAVGYLSDNSVMNVSLSLNSGGEAFDLRL